MKKTINNLKELSEYLAEYKSEKTANTGILSPFINYAKDKARNTIVRGASKKIKSLFTEPSKDGGKGITWDKAKNIGKNVVKYGPTVKALYNTTPAFLEAANKMPSVRHAGQTFNYSQPKQGIT